MLVRACGSRCAQVPSSEADPTRGGAQPSSETDFARGAGVILRARQTPPEGGVMASSEADPARGSAYPSCEANLTRGASAALHWRVVGATRVAVVMCMCFRCAS
jgi:hypothetical protein